MSSDPSENLGQDVTYEPRASLLLMLKTLALVEAEREANHLWYADAALALRATASLLETGRQNEFTGVPMPAASTFDLMPWLKLQEERKGSGQ